MINVFLKLEKIFLHILSANVFGKDIKEIKI